MPRGLSGADAIALIPSPAEVVVGLSKRPRADTASFGQTTTGTPRVTAESPSIQLTQASDRKPLAMEESVSDMVRLALVTPFCSAMRRSRDCAKARSKFAWASR